jgi:hypothetical protein
MIAGNAPTFYYQCLDLMVSNKPPAEPSNRTFCDCCFVLQGSVLAGVNF